MPDDSIPLLLDQGLPRDAALILRAAGIDCLHVGELGMAKAPDPAILAYAREGGRVIVTLDSDFHQQLALTGASGPSVIRARIEGLNGERLAALLMKLLVRYAGELQAGCMITVKARKTACRMLG